MDKCCAFHILNGNKKLPCSELSKDFLAEVIPQIARSLQEFGYAHATTEFVEVQVNRIISGTETSLMGSRKMIKTLLIKAIEK